MHTQTIFAKTPKGIMEVKNRTLRLARDLGLVFLAVDGKTPVADLQHKARVDAAALPQALEALVADGYIKVFYPPPEASPAAAPPAADFDLDFTTPAAIAQISADAERRARAEAEARATAETKLHAMEQDLKAAEAAREQALSLRARAAAEARASAETKMRAMEQDLKAAEAAREQALAKAAQAERALAQDEALAKGITVVKLGPLIRWASKATIGIILTNVLGLGVLHIIPLSGYIGDAEKLLSERLQEPVSIGSLRFTAFPTPQLRLKRIAIGSLHDVKIETAIVPISSQLLFNDRKDLVEVELLSVNIDAGAIPRLAAWAQPQPGDSKLRISRLRLGAVKLTLPGIELPSFESTVALGMDGGVQKVLLRDAKINIDLAVVKNRGLQASFFARNWRLPVGPAVEFSELSGTAMITPGHITVSGIDGTLYGGALKGSANITWDGGLSAEGEFNLKGADAVPLLPEFTQEFAASGALQMNARFAMQGQTVNELFAAPRVSARFSLLKGTLNNVDLVRAIQAPGPISAQDGSKTSFNLISGEAQAAGNHISYRDLEFRSAQLDCTGAIDVSPEGDLSGRLNLMGSQAVTVARTTLNVSGRLRYPVLSP